LGYSSSRRLADRDATGVADDGLCRSSLP
jgi:hypothetical protein